MNLNLKNTAIATLILTSNLGFCGTMGAVANADAKDGLYLGAGVGGSFDHYQLKARNLITSRAVTVTKDDSNAIGDVFVGYGYTASNLFYLGGEIGTNFPRRSITINGRPGVSITNFTYTDTLHIHDYVTLDILPGYRIMPDWLIYGRAGIAFSELSMHQPLNGPAATAAFNTSQDKVGGRFGAGVTYNIGNHLSASIDYYYSIYQDATANWSLYNEHFVNTESSNFIGASITYTL